MGMQEEGLGEGILGVGSLRRRKHLAGQKRNPQRVWFMQRNASCQIVGVGIVERMKRKYHKLAPESDAAEPQRVLKVVSKELNLI